jgi:hypothetical protein
MGLRDLPGIAETVGEWRRGRLLVIGSAWKRLFFTSLYSHYYGGPICTIETLRNRAVA